MRDQLLIKYPAKIFAEMSRVSLAVFLPMRLTPCLVPQGYPGGNGITFPSTYPRHCILLMLP